MRKWPILPFALGAGNLALQLSGYQNPALSLIALAIFLVSLVWWVIAHENTKKGFIAVKKWVDERSVMVSLLAFVGSGAIIGILVGAVAWIGVKGSPKPKEAPGQGPF